MPEQPRLYTCKKCGTEDLPADQIAVITVVRDDPDDVGSIAVRETYCKARNDDDEPGCTEKLEAIHNEWGLTKIPIRDL